MAEKSTAKIREPIGFIIGRWVIRFILLGYAISVVFPFIWTLYTSVKPINEYLLDTMSLPTWLDFSNYSYAWLEANFSGYFLNSLFLVVCNIVLCLIFSSTTAYAIVKFRYRWLKYLNVFYIVAMAMPGVLVLVPQFFLLQSAGLTGQLWVLPILYALASLPVSLRMQAGFLRGIDNALLEAADIDGATEFQKFFQIIVPSIKSALYLTTLNAIMQAWNEFILALTYLDDEATFTVPIGLSYLQNAAQHEIEFTGMIAGLVIAMVPVLVIYSIFQKPLQEGFKADGAVKG